MATRASSYQKDALDSPAVVPSIGIGALPSQGLQSLFEPLRLHAVRCALHCPLSLHTRYPHNAQRWDHSSPSPVFTTDGEGGLIPHLFIAQLHASHPDGAMPPANGTLNSSSLLVVIVLCASSSGVACMATCVVSIIEAGFDGVNVHELARGPSRPVGD